MAENNVAVRGAHEGLARAGRSSCQTGRRGNLWNTGGWARQASRCRSSVSGPGHLAGGEPSSRHGARPMSRKPAVLSTSVLTLALACSTAPTFIREASRKRSSVTVVADRLRRRQRAVDVRAEGSSISRSHGWPTRRPGSRPAIQQVTLPAPNEELADKPQ